MRTVFDFEDHRAYLRDYYEARKAESASFSYARFSRAAGFKSDNYLKLVIEGRRNLTVANIHSFARLLQLGPREHAYFEAMVLAAQADDPRDRELYRERMRTIAAGKPRRMTRAVNPGELLSRWYFPVVLLSVAGKRDAEPGLIPSLARRIGVHPADVRETLKILLQKGFLTLAEADGRYELARDYAICVDRWSASEAYRHFLKEQLARSSEALSSQYDRGAKFFAHTFTASKDALDRYADEIQAMLERVTARSDQDAPEEIVQLNVQMFPLR